MDPNLIGVLIGAFATLLIVWAVRSGLARNVSPQRSAEPPLPAQPADPTAGLAPLESPAIEDPLLSRLMAIRHRVAEAPRVYTPDDMLMVGPFAEMVEALAEPAVDTERLCDFWQSDDALLAWTALCALARRPRDERIEDRLLARINSFHHWSRHYLLRVLEAWNPEDPTLVFRVLLRLDESWEQEGPGVVLDKFLHRRFAIGTPSISGVEHPFGFDVGVISSILTRQVDPVLAAPLRKEVRARHAAMGNAHQAVMEGSERNREREEDETGAASEQRGGGVFPSAKFGRLHKPGQFPEDRAITCASADAALERLKDALANERPRSALVVGDPGVGKTSLVRRLAAHLSREGWTIFEAGAPQIGAETLFVGGIEGRVQTLIKLLARPKRLWITPDFHQLLWTGRHMQNPTGVLEMIMPAIESGEILVLGETRPAGLATVLGERPEVHRLFDIVRLEPPGNAEVAAILDAWAARKAQDLRVDTPSAVRSEAAALARHYLSGQASPGGTLRLLETALEIAAPRPGAESGGTTLSVDALVTALAHLTGLPPEILDERRPLDLEAVRRRFESRVIGQPEAVGCVVERLAMLKAGVTDPQRPIGVFLFAGPSGTGKTELAKRLAEYLFGSPDRMIRLDMSELQTAGELDRVLGANPGVVAVTAGNSLVERVRRAPFCVVLLDEFEKANPQVWNLFLQVFDDGRLTDPRGETTDFRQAIIILTSNLGAARSEARMGLVGTADEFSAGTISRAVERAFRPELRNRLDRVVVFRPLTREVMQLILRKEMADAFARRGLRRRGWAVELEESAIELLIERAFSPTLGARPLKRAIEQLLLAPLAAAIVNRSAPEGDQFLFVRADGDRLAVEFVDPDAPAEAAPASVPRVSHTAEPPATIAFEAHGTHAEVEGLRAALAALRERVGQESWRSAKEALLLEAAEPEFWTRPDRFARLGRAEYLDRIESAVRGAASLLERIDGNSAVRREAYPRDMVRRLAQQIHLLDAASREALADGPRDAFVAVEPVLDDAAPPAAAREFADRLAAMYTAWARARGMRFALLEAGHNRDGRHTLAIAGFAAFALLEAEDGLHLLETEQEGTRVPQRATVRVRVLLQPAEPPADGFAGLLRQAREALAARVAHAPQVPQVTRRYREGAAPLVRDAVRGWRTGRIDRVLAGDFDLIPDRG